MEETGDAVNVYMTLEDNGQDMNLEGYAGSEEMTDAAAAETAGSAIMTYDTAEEVTLDSSYPQDVVPLPSGAKVIGCSMVPGKASGFVDLVLPADSFDSTVTFYTDTLGLTPKTSTTAVQAAASFQGEIAGIKVSILVSNLLGGGHDTLVQITVDDK
ncbi:hypothetical protein SDC9_190247 [bioreactor metagenome]|uniref:Uncharacterized protein n=1 Tax=bioreactor metagenome TaxID=1076179 RepID=A0A645HV13_9ZZZZ